MQPTTHVVLNGLNLDYLISKFFDMLELIEVVIE
jgi:hypothetical protein